MELDKMCSFLRGFGGSSADAFFREYVVTVRMVPKILRLLFTTVVCKAIVATLLGQFVRGLIESKWENKYDNLTAQMFSPY